MCCSPWVLSFASALGPHAAHGAAAATPTSVRRACCGRAADGCGKGFAGTFCGVPPSPAPSALTHLSATSGLESLHSESRALVRSPLSGCPWRPGDEAWSPRPVHLLRNRNRISRGRPCPRVHPPGRVCGSRQAGPASSGQQLGHLELGRSGSTSGSPGALPAARGMPAAAPPTPAATSTWTVTAASGPVEGQGDRALAGGGPAGARCAWCPCHRKLRRGHRAPVVPGTEEVGRTPLCPPLWALGLTGRRRRGSRLLTTTRQVARR